MNNTLPMPLKVRPYVHQQMAFDFVCDQFGLLTGTSKSRGICLLMEMGCGKSLVAIAVAGTLYQFGLTRVLIVGPLSTLSVWEEQLSAFAAFPYMLTVLKGSSRKKREQIQNIPNSGLQIIVVNYESARILEEDLVAWRPQVTIADEGHKLKENRSQQSKAMKACADVLGMEEFDEDVFLDRVDHIEVPEKYTLELFFKDGNRIIRDCPNTGHQDCWTAEYRAATSEKRRKYGTNPRGATCFTGRIKCAECGNNYRQQTRKRKNGEKYHMFSCATTNTCGNNSIHGDDLQRLSAEAMGLDAFDASAFSERIDHVVISKGGRIAFHFKDGGIHIALSAGRSHGRKNAGKNRQRRLGTALPGNGGRRCAKA